MEDLKILEEQLENVVKSHPFSYETYFPHKSAFVPYWETKPDISLLRIAADVYDYGQEVIPKKCYTPKASGDIIPITVKRNSLREQGTSNVEYCYLNIQYTLEYIAWQLVSNAGELIFDENNNYTALSEYNLHYKISSEQKVQTTTNWKDPSKADVFGDLAKTIKKAKEMGIFPKYAFMNDMTFYTICSTNQILKKCNFDSIAEDYKLKILNDILKKEPWLNGIQFKIIPTYNSIEFILRKVFLDDRVILSETKELGTTQYCYNKLKSDNQMLEARYKYITIKKFIEDGKEITSGGAYAIPVLDTAYRNIYLRTDGKPWD